MLVRHFILFVFKVFSPFCEQYLYGKLKYEKKILAELLSSSIT